jgi:pimeloyl-ACP methyl ester carboxylesterase
MPTYYIMDLDKGVAATMAEHEPSPAQVAACKWMTEADLQVTARNSRGGLKYYRIDGSFSSDSGLNAYSGKTIDVPACYIVSSSEWAFPGSFERMHTTCTRLKGVHLVHGAGHCVVEEQPEAVNRLLLEFLVHGRLS